MTAEPPPKYFLILLARAWVARRTLYLFIRFWPIPIGARRPPVPNSRSRWNLSVSSISFVFGSARSFAISRSEEHTSELQSRENLVCRLLLEKKNVAP